MLARPWATPGLSLGPRGCVVVATLSELSCAGDEEIPLSPRHRVQAYKPNTVLSFLSRVRLIATASSVSLPLRKNLPESGRALTNAHRDG